MLNKKYSKRLVIGLIFIIISLLLGKLPLIYFASPSESMFITMLSIYLFSWVILFIGIYLCGRESYELFKVWYKNLSRRTFHAVKSKIKRKVKQKIKKNSNKNKKNKRKKIINKKKK